MCATWELTVGSATKGLRSDLGVRQPAGDEQQDLCLARSELLQLWRWQNFLSGNWVWFPVMFTMFVFNTMLGAELLFRGLLLPRMQRAGITLHSAQSVVLGLLVLAIVLG